MSDAAWHWLIVAWCHDAVRAKRLPELARRSAVGEGSRGDTGFGGPTEAPAAAGSVVGRTLWRASGLNQLTMNDGRFTVRVQLLHAGMRRSWRTAPIAPGLRPR